MAIELTNETYAPYKEKMERSIQALQENLNAVRAGRANPRVLDRITVNYYGVDTPLNQVANIQVPEPRLITIQPWEPNMTKEIEKAIQSSDLGINPNNDGKVIRLVFPMLTEERRRDLVKQVEKYGEETKVAIRNTRRECIDLIKGYEKKKEISEDLRHGAEEFIQEFTDDYTDRVDKIVADKEKDLMEI
ncbi:MAG TPA: ribosome recycling factor [Clostridiaceae bacterium]|nr:ribosome recycling factor [Clostridiaceae bacterium]